MIKEVEDLMVHWGEQRRRYGLSAGVGSQMGSIMTWKGSAPRGAPGSRPVTGGAGLDKIASEVEAALAKLDRESKKAQALAKLARLRYLHQAPVRQQMQELGLAECADRTYRNWVTRLHQQVLLILADRNTSARGAGGQTMKHSHCRALVAQASRAQS